MNVFDFTFEQVPCQQTRLSKAVEFPTQERVVCCQPALRSAGEFW